MRAILCLLAAGIVYPGWADDDNNKKTGPRIDGHIEEAEWAGAVTFDKFFVTVPRSQEKPDSTIVLIKQTPDAIYFGFRFWPKGKVIRQSLIRDRSSDEENEFFILLDLENKNQNGYFFAFSFLDNQRDMLIYNQRSLSTEWDWIWDVRTKEYVHPQNDQPGYIEAEVRIPVDRIQNKNMDQIGIDVQMFAYRPDGTSYFYSIIPESELLSLKGTYKMDVEPFEERTNFRASAIPYVVANKFTDSTFKSSVGGELSVFLDRHSLKGTYNTDESTLEADPFNFSLYGRPIFLQEKRQFFSKDLDLYRMPINLFYTRAIQNIDYGANYTYRSDHIKLASAYVREESIDGNDARTFFVTRPRMNTRLVNTGATVIYSRDPDNGVTDKIVSVDTRVDLPSRFVFNPQVIKSTDGHAYQAYMFYEYNAAGGPYADVYYRRFSKRFDALTLFNNFGPDNDEILVSGGYQFVYKRPYFSSINVRSEYYRAQMVSDRFTYEQRLAGDINYKVNDWLSAGHYLEYNRPDEQVDSVTVKTHRNFLADQFAKFLYGSHSLTVGYNVGPYFGSTLHNPYATLNLYFFSRLSGTFTLTRVGNDDFQRNIYGAKIDYRVFRKLYLRTYLQHRVDEDKEAGTKTRQNLWNSLVQYEFFAGSNVYFVLNLQGKRLDNVGRYFKIGYEFRI